MCGTLFCDIDGTIADIAHRRAHLTGDKKNWTAFERGMILDTPVPHVIDAVKTLYDSGWKVVMCTGRSERNRAVTEYWLKEHGIPYHALYARAEYLIDPVTGLPQRSRKGKLMPDSRRDDIVKEELLQQARRDGYDPDIVFDDRDQVVAMWRREGVPCIQVAEGDF